MTEPVAPLPSLLHPTAFATTHRTLLERTPQARRQDSNL
jgi:hypothetical protein